MRLRRPESALEVRCECLTLTHRQRTDRLVIREQVLSEKPLDALGAVPRDREHDDSDLRGVQVSGRITENDVDRYTSLPDVHLEGGAQHTHFGRASERIQALALDGRFPFGLSLCVQCDRGHPGARCYTVTAPARRW